MRRKFFAPLFVIVLLALGGLAATLLTDSSPELGLDLQGGVSVVLAPTTDATGEQLDQALEIIRARVDALGVAEPEIARQGDAIVVQLPGVRNRDRAIELVGQTAELRFRPVIQVLGPAPADGSSDTTDTTGTTGTTGGSSDTTGTTAPADDTTGTSEGAAPAALAPGRGGVAEGESAMGAQTDPTATTAPADPTATTAPAGEPTTDPSGLTPREDDDADAQVVLADKEGNRYELGPSLATGRIVESAQAEIPQGAWQVGLSMRGGENGIDKFNEIASQCFSQAPTCPSGQLAIVLDSVVQSAPQIQAPSYSRDQIRISGSFSQSEAKNLALVLRYGSLPVELERQTVQTVSASLGEDSLHAGIVAGIVGLILVAAYMVLYYRALGLVVILGLGVWGALLYTLISWLGETRGLALTLSGVTGIIVSIGVTVDSYVVFFERLKDEVKAGRTLRTSTERAFKRAFRTILAADISSFLGAAVLWWLTVGSVRGFAFFLGLSTVLDVIVAWSFTRPMVTWLSRNRVFTEMPVLGVARGLAREPAPVPGRERRPAAAATGAGR
ncbi:MAG TPA: protein translocase subunit SecD [Acidimicrobiales bacterium]